MKASVNKLYIDSEETIKPTIIAYQSCVILDPDHPSASDSNLKRYDHI